MDGWTRDPKLLCMKIEVSEQKGYVRILEIKKGHGWFLIDRAATWNRGILELGIDTGRKHKLFALYSMTTPGGDYRGNMWIFCRDSHYY